MKDEDRVSEIIMRSNSELADNLYKLSLPDEISHIIF